MITTENWNFVYYESETERCIITLSAEPEGTLYSVTLVDPNHYREIEQVDFFDLSQACEHINRVCSKWKFVDPSISTKSGSCAGCQAH